MTFAGDFREVFFRGSFAGDFCRSFAGSFGDRVLWKIFARVFRLTCHS